MPDLFRRFPRERQADIAYRCIRPAGAYWLPRRLEHVPIHLGRTVTAIQPSTGGATVQLDDGTALDAEHVLLGTGFEVDVARYPFLDADLIDAITRENGYPELGPGLESSVPGLHFVGAPAALAFGPVMRFVVGSWYAAPAVTRRARGRWQPPFRRSF